MENGKCTAARGEEETAPSFCGWNWAALSLWYATAVVAIALGVLGLRTIGYTINICTDYPYQLDREEGFLLNQAVLLTRGETIYQPIEDYPYLVGNYTPVYPALFAGGVAIAGPTLTAGRVVVLLATLLIVVLMGVYAARMLADWPLALLAPGLFLATYDLNHWIAFARVDLPAIAFGLAGFVAAFRGKKKVWLPASIILFTLAVYTKQSQILAPAAVFGAMLVLRRWRIAGIFAGGMIIAGAIPGLILLLITKGEFWRHTVTYNANEFFWNQVFTMLKHLWFFARWMLIAAIIAFGLLAWKTASQFKDDEKRNETQQLIALLIYVILATFSLVGHGKAGSAINYFLEFHVVMGLLIATGLRTVIYTARRAPAASWMTGSAAVVLALLLAFHGWRVWAMSGIIIPPSPPDRAGEPMQAALLEVVEADGDVLTEDPVLNIMAGKEVLYQPFIMATLAREGQWDPSEFVTDIEEQRFSLIMTEKNLEREYFYGFTEEMRDAILRNYELRGEIPVYPNGRRLLYRPNPAP